MPAETRSKVIRYRRAQWEWPGAAEKGSLQALMEAALASLCRLELRK